jgi:heme A synthase
VPVSLEAPPLAASRRHSFRRFAWSVLIYNLAVVLWGAYVRASGSGAGCGSHWPLCNGVVVPHAPRVETIIEFVHRLTSGLSLVLVGGLWWWSRRVFARGQLGRRMAAWAVFLLIVEALLGAGLVLFRFVAHDASAGRAFYLSAHLVNTQLLLGVLAATAWLADREAILQSKGVGPLLVSLVVGITGAVAALGDTLYPAASLASGVSKEFAAGAPVLLRLRLIHPVVAVAAGLYLMRGGGVVLAFVLVQFGAGLLNWILLAPIWMQLVHLMIADLLWIALVIRYLRRSELCRT